MKRINRWMAGLTAVAVLGPASLSMAVDGVLEINQTCAVNTGCGPGDSAGFPATISAPGSYRLTSNLAVAGSGTNAIQISASDVTLDLNGFTISGPNTCTGDPVTSCASTGIGDGVAVSSTNFVGVTVKNGTVRGMGDRGISLNKGGNVENVFVRENGGNGIFCRNACTVSNARVLRNGADGISQSSLLTPPLVSPASLFRDNLVSGNNGWGLRTNDQTSLSLNNVFYGNTDEGLAIFVSGDDAGYVGNVLRNNNGGSANPQVTGGTEIGTNFCGTDTICP